MIGVEKFLAAVEQISAEEPSYRHGGYGQDGTCDCIGLIIGAIRRCGGEWRGTHGSNYAARNEMVSLYPITSEAELRPGELVYKVYEPNQGKYALPERYSRSGDLRDYYHVGVVISADPLRIRHMTTPRPKTDKVLGKWAYHGMLKKISAETREVQTLERVIISGGDTSQPIHMRKAESTASAIVADIPQGSEAVMLARGAAWSQITWSGRSGYVMSKFVGTAAAPAPEAGDTVTVDRAELEKIYDQIGDWLGLRG